MSAWKFLRNFYAAGAGDDQYLQLSCRLCDECGDLIAEWNLHQVAYPSLEVLIKTAHEHFRSQHGGRS